MNNLLAQRKEIKQLEKEMLEERQKEEQDATKMDKEASELAVKDFEMVQIGLHAKLGSTRGQTVIGREGGKVIVEEADDTRTSKSGTKRKFEIDEDELFRIAKEERTKAKKTLDDERQASKPRLPSFWVPSETPTAGNAMVLPKTPKLDPVCPASSEDSIHNYSLKTLTDVHFVEERDTITGTLVRSCPACRKGLNNATKAMLAIPCGHVLCKPCVAKFMTPRSEPDAYEPGTEYGILRCYVCELDLTGKSGKGSKKDKEKGKPKPGVIEIRSDGTGFAGGGKNMVQKKGTAFQC